MYNFIAISILLMFSTPVEDALYLGYPTEDTIGMMLDEVNQLRAKGCQCGSEYMYATESLTWNSTLYTSALSHAKEMDRKNFFSHISTKGLDIGDRLDKFGYPWQVAGENLGEGQKSFNEVMRDWVDSPSHCKMLMNPKIKEMAVARYSRYWVQHFGKKLPYNRRK